MMIKKLLCTFVIMFFFVAANAQQPKTIDSLLQVIKTTSSDSIKLFNISLEGNTLLVLILENGSEFDQNTLTIGKGLNNMKKRASELKGKFKIITEIKKVTTVLAEVPAKVTNAIKEAS